MSARDPGADSGQAAAAAAYRAAIRQCGFDTRGLFDDLRPLPEAVQRLYPTLSRGERTRLAFLLTVWDPALKRELAGDVDVLAQIQSLDAHGRALIAAWVAAPFFLRPD